MNYRNESLAEYRLALKKGQKYYHDCLIQGVFPFPQVLDEILNESSTMGRVEMGTLDIPMDRIVGTLAAGRRNAFAGNFMPLLDVNSEFAAKWVSLCAAHLTETGITDPITVLEYMGRFYVREGHKRTSVLRHFGAPTIRATVTRIIPAWSEDPAVLAYYEFMKFYRFSSLYHLRFTRPGCYPRFQAAMGFEEDHVWTEEERLSFLSFYWSFRSACQSMPALLHGLDVSDVLLACMEIYNWKTLDGLDAAEMSRRIRSVEPDLRYMADDGPSNVSTEPETQEKSVLGKLLDGLTRAPLSIAFIHALSPERSAWSRGHEQGRLFLQQAMGDRVSTESFVADAEDPDRTMEEAVARGAQVLMVTAATLLAPARRVAALHPQLKVLVCALSVPFAGIRTYYTRTYEAKFITGAVAGAMWNGGSIGYIARYPILGEAAAINAFALGVRMTAPNVNIQLAWSSVDRDPIRALVDRRCRIISGQETNVQETGHDGSGMSTIQMQPNGAFLPLASACWNWGRLYEQMVNNILSGGWEITDPGRGNAVNYWWGMNSGVIDVIWPESLPAGVAQLADILRENLLLGHIHLFHCRMQDQQGLVRNDGEAWLTPEEIMHMNWLMDNVVGTIPTLEEVMPMARETTRLLSLEGEGKKGE